MLSADEALEDEPVRVVDGRRYLLLTRWEFNAMQEVLQRVNDPSALHSIAVGIRVMDNVLWMEDRGIH